jgi:hypothetical protein
MKRILAVLLALLSICVVSCSRIADTETKTSGSNYVTSGSAKVKVRELLKSDNPVKILAVVENTGTSDADNLSYNIKPRKGSVTLEEHAVTTNHTLAAGDDTWIEVIFSTLETHNDYDDIVFDFSWTEAKQGTISLTSLVKK